MKRIFIIIFLLQAILSAFPAFAQKQSLNLPELKNYKRVKIGLNDYKKLEGKSLSIFSDSIKFSDFTTRTPRSLSLEEINYIRVQTGSQTGIWALYGGLFMAASCLIAVADVASNPNLTFNDNAGTVVVVSILGGVAVGALIGSTIPKWKTYYIHNRVGYKMPLNYGVYAWKGQVGLSVKLNF